MAAKFNSGDLVELKSGGPVMAVERVSPSFNDEGGSSYSCTWFAGDKHQHNQFEEAVLKLAENE